MIVGAASVSYGAWMISAPFGYIVGGAIAMTLGLMAARAGE
jgi:hypothetical protein